MKHFKLLIGLAIFFGSNVHNLTAAQRLPHFSVYRDPEFQAEMAAFTSKIVPGLITALSQNDPVFFEQASTIFFDEQLPHSCSWLGYDQDVIFPVLEAAISHPDDRAITLLLQHEKWEDIISWLGDSVSGLLLRMAKNGHTKNAQSILARCFTKMSSDSLSALPDSLLLPTLGNSGLSLIRSYGKR